MSNENRWLRINDHDNKWHVNPNKPATPQQVTSFCNIITKTPIYSSTLYGVGSPMAPVNRCLQCDIAEGNSNEV